MPFKGNALQIGAYGFTQDQHIIRTNYATKAKFGPSGATLGLNDIVADGVDWFVLEDDSDSTHTLPAVDN